RALGKMWIGQPLLTDALLERFDISKKKSKDDIWLHIQLNDQQVDQIKRSLNNRGLISHILLDISAHFDSGIGRLHVARRIERSDVPLKAGRPEQWLRAQA